MSLKFEISGAQIDGARDYQEDSFLISHLQVGNGIEQISLAIVADGMGGHAAGNVASNLAIQSFNKHVTAHYPSDSIPELLKEAVEEANNAIAKTISETAALKGMGCTLVAALCIGDKLCWVSVGDSHLFHLQKKVLTKINADHSYGGYLDRMEAEGNKVEEKNGYSRNMLLSALTGEAIPAIDCPEQPTSLDEGDQLLLCSDGIDTLDPESIEASSNSVDNPKQLTEELLANVEKAQQPRQDNTTVVVVSVISSPDMTQVSSEVDLPSPEIPSIKQNTIQQQPLPAVHSIETKYRGGSTKTSSSFSWFILTCLLAALAAGGWWYMNEKPLLISKLFPETEPEPVEVEETVVIDDPIAVIEPEIETTIPEIKITKFKDRLARGGSAPEMIWISSGSFEMGGTGSTPPMNERPHHNVTLTKFAISSKEVTRGEFAKYSGITVSNTNKNQPVRNVSWKAAKKYTNWLSKQTGATYRLPTEAEWEYAARAGTTSPFWWGHKIGIDNALCFGCTTPLEPTRPNDTGSYAANAFGLHDTAGNIAEWVEDCYHGDYEGAPEDGSAWNSTNCKERGLRGGSYLNASKSLFVSRRDKLAANKSENHIGIRIVREE